MLLSRGLFFKLGFHFSLNFFSLVSLHGSWFVKVNIWEERKVFGSRGQSLKDEMLGKIPPPTQLPSSNGKSSNPIKIVKRDAHSVRIVRA